MAAAPRYGRDVAARHRPGALAWMRANLFSGVGNTLLTLVALYVIVRAVWGVVDWGLVHAVWSAPDGRACRAASDGEGACWAFLGVWGRFILFGRYPYAEQWRPLVVVVLFVALHAGELRPPAVGRADRAGVGGGDRRRISGSCSAAWPGLAFVPTDLWSGLPLTLILAIVGLALAFPLAIVLALGRRSTMPAVRALSVAYIELIRGVPLITVLFMASVMLPLFLPEGTTIDKLLARAGRVHPVLRRLSCRGRARRAAGDPQGPEARRPMRLGLGYWRKMRLVILPQALKIAIPPLVNVFIAGFKDTTLVTIIGLFDLISTASNAITDPVWRGFYAEAYGFVGGFLFRLLLLHVALQPGARAQPGEEPAMSESDPPPMIELQPRPQMVWRLSRAQRCLPAVARGERVVVCGPSGSGKSTMIRCINRPRSSTRKAGSSSMASSSPTMSSRSRRSAARSAWCSSSSISSRI